MKWNKEKASLPLTLDAHGRTHRGPQTSEMGDCMETGELLARETGEEKDFKAINTPKIYHQVDKLSE